MSKESAGGFKCKCNQTIAYPEYHWQHCPENDKWSLKKKKEEKNGGS